MEKCMPRNGKEGLIYGVIMCGLSCMFMATMNICINTGGISTEALLKSLKAFPLVFIIAMLIEVLIVGKIVDKLVDFFSSPTDSINAQILFRTFFVVVGMSIIMTNVGGVLSSGFKLEVIKEFPRLWPRNFSVIIFMELLIISPIARKVMRIMHGIQEKNKIENEDDLDDSLSA